MVRIADILKRAKELKGEEKSPVPPTSVPRPPSFPKGTGDYRHSSPVAPSTQLSPPPTETFQRPSPPASPESGGKGFSFSNLGGKMASLPSRPQTFSQSGSTLPPREPPTVGEGPASYVAQAIKGSETSKQKTAEDVYSKALSLAQTILEKAQTGEEITGKEIKEVIENVIRELTYENNELLTLAINQVVEEGSTNFISADMVNKTILAVEIGIGKKLNKSKLFQLGMAAFFSELGIIQMLDIATKKEALTEEEQARIRELPNKTVEILKKIPDLNQVVLTVARESKERLDASGPLGIADIQQLDEFSRIVAVIDVFESLTHDRPHRKRLLPHQAMKTILEEGGKFEAEVLKLLIDLIGIYPIGSWVKLTNKEVAKVMGSNPGQPLRPKLKVLFDERGAALEEPQSLDLSKNLSIQILQPVSEEQLKEFVKGAS